MPNPVQAAAEGLPEINRRRLLGGIVAASAASAVAGGSAALAATHEPEMTPRERFAFHLAGLKAAAEELDPRIGSWSILRSEDDDMRCVLAVSAHRVTGRYEGDGTYEAGAANVSGKIATYVVALLSDRADGHRTFSVRTSMDHMVLAEPRLNTFIGRRVS